MAGRGQAADTSPLPPTNAPDLNLKISELTRPMSSPRGPELLSMDNFDDSDDSPNAPNGTGAPRDIDGAGSVRPIWTKTMSPLESAIKFDSIRRSDQPVWQDDLSEQPYSVADTDSVAAESVRPTWLGDTDSVVTAPAPPRWMRDTASEAGESERDVWLDDTGSVALGSRQPAWKNAAQSTGAPSEVGSVRPRWLTGDIDDTRSQRPGWMGMRNPALTSISDGDNDEGHGGSADKRLRPGGNAETVSTSTVAADGVVDFNNPPFGRTDRRQSRTPAREDERPLYMTRLDVDGKLWEPRNDREHRLSTEVITS